MLYCGLRPHETAYVQGKDVEGDVLHVFIFLSILVVKQKNKNLRIIAIRRLIW